MSPALNSWLVVLHVSSKKVAAGCLQLLPPKGNTLFTTLPSAAAPVHTYFNVFACHTIWQAICSPPITCFLFSLADEMKTSLSPDNLVLHKVGPSENPIKRLNVWHLGSWATSEQRPEKGHLPACSLVSLLLLHWHMSPFGARATAVLKWTCRYSRRITWDAGKRSSDPC